MSGPIKMRIGPRLAKLRAYLEETKPIIEAQQRTPEGIEKLRINLVKIKQALLYLESQDGSWQKYIEGLPEARLATEEKIYQQYAQGERHFAEWLDDARSMIVDGRIILSDESDPNSDVTRLSREIRDELEESDEEDREQMKCAKKGGAMIEEMVDMPLKGKCRMAPKIREEEQIWCLRHIQRPRHGHTFMGKYCVGQFSGSNSRNW